jgi:hypothetical protein
MTYLNGMIQLQLDRILIPFQVPTMGSYSAILGFLIRLFRFEEFLQEWWDGGSGQIATC